MSSSFSSSTRPNTFALRAALPGDVDFVSAYAFGKALEGGVGEHAGPIPCGEAVGTPQANPQGPAAKAQDRSKAPPG